MIYFVFVTSCELSPSHISTDSHITKLGDNIISTHAEGFIYNYLLLNPQFLIRKYVLPAFNDRAPLFEYLPVNWLFLGRSAFLSSLKCPKRDTSRKGCSMLIFQDSVVVTCLTPAVAHCQANDSRLQQRIPQKECSSSW